MSENPAEGLLDVRELRRALGTFVTGVTVLTALDQEGRGRGLTANSFTSVSLDPPLVLVCINQGTASSAVFAETAEFGVNILAEDQIELAERFAASGPDKFAGVSLVENRSGPPILTGCPAWLHCEVSSRFELGDHLIVVGRVLAFATSSSQPLTFCQGGYVSLAPDTIEAIGDASARVVISWLVASDEAIALSASSEGYALPTTPWLGSRLDDDGLASAFSAMFHAAGEVQSLFAVFDDHERGVLTLVYRAQLHRPLRTRSGLETFAPDAIPWDLIGRRHVRDTLQRYLRERVTNQFGIYSGSLKQGRVFKVESITDQQGV